MTRTRLALYAAASLAGLVAGCTQEIGDKATLDEVDSLIVNLVDPAEGHRGTEDMPLDRAKITSVTVDVAAVTKSGTVYAHDLDVDVYLAYGGAKIGQLQICGKNEDSVPLATIHLVGGKASNAKIAMTQPAYGKVNLWFEVHGATGTVDGGTISLNNDGGLAELIGPTTRPQAYGASQEMFFPYPTIPEIQTPLDPTKPEAAYCSAWNGKQVNVVQATGSGKLVVTSVFSGAYVVADTGAQYDPTTGMGGYNHLYVFSFGKPPYFITPGRVLGKVGGNISKFVGFTELNFPYQNPAAANDTAALPTPYEITAADAGQNVRLLKLSAATVHSQVIVCPIAATTDTQWIKYDTFNIRFAGFPNASCGAFGSFSVAMTGKTMGNFDPLKLEGKTVSVTGMLRNQSGQNEATVPPTDCRTDVDCTGPAVGTTCVEGSCKKGVYNFWSINPRDATDLVVMP